METVRPFLGVHWGLLAQGGPPGGQIRTRFLDHSSLA